MRKHKRLSFAWLFLITLLVHTNSIFGQQLRSDLSAYELNVKGVENEKLLQKLYVGNFDDIKFKDDDIKKGIVFMSYLRSYSDYCRSALPADRIQLMTQECARGTRTINGYGAVISETCYEYRDVPTGIFVAPIMYRTKQQLEGKALDDVFKLITSGFDKNKNPATGFMTGIDLLKFSSAVQNDMNDLVRVNSCKSPELMQFQENIRLFVLDRQPIRLDYDEAMFAGPKPPSDPDKQDFTELIDDLVMEDARSWMMNKYQNGSISDVTISSTDPNGNPSRIHADYIFLGGFNEKKFRGSVTVTLDAGIPECLYFSDFPDRCKAPDSDIIAAYSRGDYNKYSNQGTQAEDNTKEMEPLVAAEQMPELIDGLAALQAKVKYPEMARKANIEGRVIVQFIVDQNGNVIEPKVIRGIGGGADEEALRVIKLAKFKPGRQRGKPVPVQYSLPILFRQ